TVVRAAEPLHVNFAVDDDGTLVQVPRDAGAWSPEVLDLRGAADPDAQSLAWMRERMARPLDLGRDELTTFAVHRLADDRIRIFQQYHHIVNDGYGMGIVAREVTRAYRRGAPSAAVGEWTLQKYVEADSAYREGPAFGADRDYWLGRMADLPPATRLLSGEYPASLGVTSAAVTVDVQCRALLDERAAAAGLRLPTLLIALVGAFAARRAGTEELLVNLPTTARGARELKRMPAMVASVLPLRTEVDPGSTVPALARAVDAELYGLLAHGRFRGEDLGAELARRDPSWRPPGGGTNVTAAVASELDGTVTTEHPLSSGPVGEVEFVVVLRGKGQPLEIGLRSHADAAGECAVLAEALGAFLDAYARRPDAHLAELP